MSILDNKSQLSPQSQLRADNVKSVFFNIGKRTLDPDNPFKTYQHDENMKLSVSKLTDEQVQASQIYSKLLDKIEQLKADRQSSQLEHQQRIQDIDYCIKFKKQSIHQCKFNAWELKNEIMALEEELAQEIQQNQEMERWFCGDPDEPASSEQNQQLDSQDQPYRNEENGQEPQSETHQILSLSSNQISISCSDV